MARRPGRPTKLTPKLKKALIALLRKGLFRGTASRRLGVAHETFCNWIRRGRDGDAGYVDFLKEVQDAEAAYIEERHNNVNVAGDDPKYWQASAWMLKIKDKEHYGDYADEIKELKQQIAELLLRLPPLPIQTPPVQSDGTNQRPEATPTASPVHSEPVATPTNGEPVPTLES